MWRTKHQEAICFARDTARGAYTARAHTAGTYQATGSEVTPWISRPDERGTSSGAMAGRRVGKRRIRLSKTDRDRFRAWSNSYLAGVGTQNFPVDVVTEFVMYLRDLVAHKRTEPDDKLLSAMISARDNEDRLTENELTSMCFPLIIAGYETTVNLIGNGAYLLLDNPETADRLRHHHDHIPAAVEEFLRFESPVPGASFRVATETLELGGETIEEGQMVLISLLSANRDQELFTDSHRLDAERTPNQHIAFGYGMHYCLGAPLARLEAQIAFRQLLERFPKMERTDPTADLKCRPGLVMRGLTELPVRLTP